jgi:hypothetical protein
LGVNASLAAIRDVKREQHDRLVGVQRHMRALAESTSQTLEAVLAASKENREAAEAAVEALRERLEEEVGAAFGMVEAAELALREELVSTEACMAELSDRTWAALRVHLRVLTVLAWISLAEAAAIVWLVVR